MGQRHPLAGNAPLEPKPGKPSAPAKPATGPGRSRLSGPKEWPKLPGTAEAEEHHDTQNTSAPDELAEEQKDAERSQQRHIAADTTTECFSAA
jgi:hypothetical protein